MKYFETDASGRDYSEIISSVRNDFKGCCVYCSHCQPCPAGIDIASVNRYLDVARLDAENIPQPVRSDYLALSHTGNECENCGSCENLCPFGVTVMKNMAEAAKLFGR